VPPQLSPAVVALLVVSVIWLAVEFRQGRRTRPAATKAQDRCSRIFTFAPSAGIASGPYRLVRHPSYAGITLASVGVVTLMSNWLSLGVVAVAIVVFLIAAIKVEEEVIHRELGDAYRAYATATPYRLVPFIW
jgi:protein-S-isoprenylcysteine O-methyltransferase Ste14